MIFALPRTIVTVGYGLGLSLLSPALLTTPPPLEAPVHVPILEVIKVYGKLAGPTCFGKLAPTGSSCQVTRQDWNRLFFSNENDNDDDNSSSKQQLAALINQLDFQWPLKPYGVEKSESKTAVMNKGAETRLYMEQLEIWGLYDRRNPTGPLPTSLRPQLNRLLQQETVATTAMDLFLQKLTGTNGVEMTESLFQGKDAIDYYDFLDFLGKNSITWD